MATLTKADLARHLSEEIGFNQSEAKRIVDVFFAQIRQNLAQGENVKLSGLGHFALRKKPQRPGRNPRTGESVSIASRCVVTFHASKKLKQAVEAGVNLQPSEPPTAS
jgi:integration host factor subunit alpha